MHSFNPKDFLNTIQSLQTVQDEAHYRAIIGRCYYAVYGHLSNQTRHLSTSPSAHDDLIKRFSRSNNSNDRKIGSKLETLFKKRKDADYKYQQEINIHTANYCFDLANEIIELSKNITT